MTEDKKIKIEKVIIEKINYNVHILNDARMYSDNTHHVAYLIKNAIVDGPSLQLLHQKNSIIKDNIVFKIGTPKFKTKLKGTLLSFLIGGSGNNNYWHWLIDILPKFKILENYLDQTNFFLFSNAKNKFQSETLEYLGIPKKKIISSIDYSHIESNKIITCQHPYNLTNNPNFDHLNIPLWISRYLKEKFLFLASKNSNKFSNKFYIDRSDSVSVINKERYIVNDEEVKLFLIKRGYSIIKLSDLSFASQVSLFNSASSIIGLHGAGFANLAFCKAGTNVLELQSNTAGDILKNFSLDNKLNYKKISLKPIDFNFKNQSGAISVNLDHLNEYLDSL